MQSWFLAPLERCNKVLRIALGLVGYTLPLADTDSSLSDATSI
ncbi:hypothetical protein ACVW0A_005700 [Pseudomonas sp. TE3610]